jgi:hypothetical protein
MNQLKQTDKWWQSEDSFLLGFAALKLIIHLATNRNYGFHRDEYLYLDEGMHLSWGFMEVPPITPFMGRIALLLGGDIQLVRFFPALIGAITIFLLGKMIKEMGGDRWAQILGCSVLLFTPYLLGSNHLFQPVSFNQFWWFLSAYFIVRLINSGEAKYWYILGLVAGIGFLTKYSIGFFYAAFALGILLTPHRRWLGTRYPYLAILIAFAIALPNLFWQYQHNWPVLHHMQELSQTQLTNVSVSGFISAQFLMQFGGNLLWLPGLIYLLIHKSMRPYRLLAWIYFLVLLILILLRGKDYYTLGTYAMLYAAGAIFWARLLEARHMTLKWGLPLLVFTLNLLVIPYVLPVLSIQKMKNYCNYMADHYGLTGPLIWENGRRYDLPQDYADMHGWEEMVEKVAKVYHSLSAEDQQACMIQGSNYGHAGAINYFRKKYNLPEAYSFSSSYVMWLPDSLRFNRQILIDDARNMTSPYFNSVVLTDSVENPNARDPGYILYRTQPKVDLEGAWQQLVREEKAQFNF